MECVFVSKLVKVVPQHKIVAGLLWVFIVEMMVDALLPVRKKESYAIMTTIAVMD
jgi:hypothetical protein